MIKKLFGKSIRNKNTTKKSKRIYCMGNNTSVTKMNLPIIEDPRGNLAFIQEHIIPFEIKKTEKGILAFNIEID